MNRILHYVGKLRALFGRGKQTLFPMVQTCHVHFSSIGILVLPVHGDVTGFTQPGRPAELLPLDSSTAKIGGAVLAALAAGEDGLSSEALEERSHSVLKDLREPSWGSVEDRWEVILVSKDSEREKVRVNRTRRYRRGGFRGDDPQFELEPNAAEIGSTIKKLISLPPKEPIKDSED